MRLLLLIILLCWSVSGLAELICINPTTQFYFQKSEAGYKLVVISPYGPEFTPVYDGQVIPATLGQIKEDGEALKKLGKKITVLFSAEKCRQEEGFVLCESGIMSSIDGATARFYSTLITEKSLRFNYDYFRTSLVMLIDGKQYQVSSRYHPDTCSIF